MCKAVSPIRSSLLMYGPESDFLRKLVPFRLHNQKILKLGPYYCLATQHPCQHFYAPHITNGCSSMNEEESKLNVNPLFACIPAQLQSFMNVDLHSCIHTSILAHLHTCILAYLHTCILLYLHIRHMCILACFLWLRYG